MLAEWGNVPVSHPTAAFDGGITMYDVLIIGAGPGGIFTAYELMERRPDLKVAVFETGHPLNRRKCPIDGEKVISGKLF